MSLTVLTTSPVWTAAGWTMLHLVWVGAVIALLAVFSRRLLQSAGPEGRHAVALVWLLLMAGSPVVIFLGVFEPDSKGKMAEAMKLAASLDTAEQRLMAYDLVAIAIRDGRTTQ